MDQVGDDLGVGLRFERIAQRLQARALFLVVLDDAVVDQGHAVADVRMRVGLGDAAMGGPAGVADAQVRVEAFGQRGAFHFRDPAGAAHAADLVALDHGDAGRIVTAVFQPLQSFDQYRNHIAIRDRTNNAAHVGMLQVVRRPV